MILGYNYTMLGRVGSLHGTCSSLSILLKWNLPVDYPTYSFTEDS